MQKKDSKPEKVKEKPLECVDPFLLITGYKRPTVRPTARRKNREFNIRTDRQKDRRTDRQKPGWKTGRKTREKENRWADCESSTRFDYEAKIDSYAKEKEGKKKKTVMISFL